MSNVLIQIDKNLYHWCNIVTIMHYFKPMSTTMSTVSSISSIIFYWDAWKIVLFEYKSIFTFFAYFTRGNALLCTHAQWKQYCCL